MNIVYVNMPCTPSNPGEIEDKHFMLTPEAITVLSSINSKTQNQKSFSLLSFQISSLQAVCSGRHLLWLFVRENQIHFLLHAT